MNLLHDLVKQTTIYQKLQRDLSLTNNEYEKLICKYEEQCKKLVELKSELEFMQNNLINYTKISKKHARKIYKSTTDKDIRKLCNKILKGEK